MQRVCWFVLGYVWDKWPSFFSGNFQSFKNALGKLISNRPTNSRITGFWNFWLENIHTHYWFFSGFFKRGWPQFSQNLAYLVFFQVFMTWLHVTFLARYIYFNPFLLTLLYPMKTPEHWPQMGWFKSHLSYHS